ncbi:hypothetical protein Talka_00725 [Tepidimonas alkaliphilus]|uniref:DUF1840 domain-containing protein n=1 Tax=Tepidimonas alkaliphilus TaxID=2588942 RepID=A0A554WBW5_9BURK|nr:DUF1840 domain-containing protein [Tepidimonas alkaliphilus]TSE21061.1 hypothetical protein Talka_00725 [Tepidimonas alkaliphilus]
MLYRFRSKATGDVVMLGKHARRVLAILGKDPDGPGIVLPEQIPASIAALRAAVAQEEAWRAASAAQKDEPPQTHDEERDDVTLRMRVAPLLDMLQRCERAGCEIVWGVE